MLEGIKAKITGDVISAYLGGVAHSETLEELVAPSKAVIQQIVSLVMPKLRVEYVPEDLEMPQDRLDEERKDEVSFDERISAWARRLKATLERKANEI